MRRAAAGILAILATFTFLAACSDDDSEGDDVADDTEEGIDDGTDDDEETDDSSDSDPDAVGDGYVEAVSSICATYAERRPAIRADSDFAAAADQQLAANAEAHDALTQLDPGDDLADLHDALLSHFDPEKPELQAFLEALRAGDTAAIEETASAGEMDEETASRAAEAGITC